MTASIILFPSELVQPSELDGWKARVIELHPDWDPVQVETTALLCMSIDRGVKRLEAQRAGLLT